MKRARNQRTMSEDEKDALALKIYALAVDCPGLSYGEIAVSLNVSKRFVAAHCKAMEITTYNRRFRRSTFFNGMRLNQFTRQSLYPSAPYRLGHVDSTLVGARVRGGTTTLLWSGAIIDGLTGFGYAKPLTADRDLGWLVANAAEFGHRWGTYLYDQRADTLPIQYAANALGSESREQVNGTIWNNIRVERFHYHIKRHLAKFPRADYVVDSHLDRRIGDAVAEWNQQTPGGIDGTRNVTAARMSRETLQQIAEPWPKEALQELATLRGRDIVSMVPLQVADDSEWGYVLTDGNEDKPDAPLARFGAANPDGFYWAQMRT